MNDSARLQRRRAENLTRPRLHPAVFFPAFLPVFLIVSFRPAAAEAWIKDVRWALVEKENGKKVGYRNEDVWRQPPAAKLLSKPRVVVSLVNRGPKPAEGVLLRYAVRALLAKTEKPEDPGVWSVPFWVEERRVPWLRANQAKEVAIDSMLLATYLKKTYRAGYWPKAVMIQVMVEPKPGEELRPAVEKELSLDWGKDSRK